ncbi:MAG: methionine--tRNA ligase [Polyangiaceae bacterium]
MTQSENSPGSIVLSTTIPYVNARPHVGFALEVCQADALRRHFLARGFTVHASTGSDDHSLKNVRAAAARGQELGEFIAENCAAFEALPQLLEARFDDFVSTSRDARHAESVAALWSACAARGDLVRRSYSGQYCVGCEQFYRPEELLDGNCPEHARPTELVTEENWFFRLSRYQQELEELIETDRLQILPRHRKAEVLSFVRRGLEDFSVSRSAARARDFGLRVPDDDGQVVYVWFDALANYLTTCGYGGAARRTLWHEAEQRVHVLGKGVTRFHAVYWPALLLSAGLPLPNQLRVHAYLTFEGRKIGKSAGNAIDVEELVREYGTSALRYYLLRHLSSGQDADFSRERLVQAHDGELADELGNLVLRVLTLVRRLPPTVHQSEPTEAELALEALALGVRERVDAALAEHELAQAFDEVWKLVRASNRYLEQAQPWRLRDEPRLATVLSTALGALRVLSLELEPFLPDVCQRLRLAVATPSGVNSTQFRALDSLHGAFPEPTRLVPKLSKS